MSKKQHPPTSQRYCACCKNEMTFKYNRNIGHSCCIECGWHYIPTLDPTGMYTKEVEAFLKAKEEHKSTPEYQARKRQQEERRAKISEFHMLAFSKEALEYRRQYKERNNRRINTQRRYEE